MNTYTARAGELPLFDYDCTAQEAIESQADNAKKVEKAIINAKDLSPADKDALTGRLSRIGLNKAIRLAHETYNYQGESAVAALPCSNFASTLPKTVEHTLKNDIKLEFIRRGVTGAKNLVEIVEPELVADFRNEMESYRIATGKIRTKKKETGQEVKPQETKEQAAERRAKELLERLERAQNVFVYTVSTGIYHRLTAGDSLSGFNNRKNSISVKLNPDEFMHMVFGELYSDGQAIKGTRPSFNKATNEVELKKRSFGEFLNKSSFGVLSNKILNGDLDLALAPRAYSINLEGEGGEIEKVSVNNGCFARYQKSEFTLTARGYEGFIYWALSKTFFPIKKNQGKGKSDYLIDGDFSLFLSGLYPLLQCCAKWAKDNHRKLEIDADNLYQFFLALMFSDKNAKQLGITNADFDAYFKTDYYSQLSTVHYVRLGEIPVAEIFGLHWQNSKGHTSWTELIKRINAALLTFYSFMKNTELLEIYTARLALISTRLYLPVDAWMGKGAVRIRTAAFDEWCVYMNEKEQKQIYDR